MVLAGCDGGDSLERVSGPTMGSSFTVQYVRSPGSPGPEEVKGEVETLLAVIDRTFSTYRSDSDIERFNVLPANSCQVMPQPLLRLVQVGEQLAEQSQGAFDLTVGPLLNLWGFGPQAREARVPDAQALASARQRVGYRHLRIQGDRLCKDAAVEVDFNSIAAGYAVDEVVERLQALGVTSYLVEVTGELRAAGRKPDGSHWRVALEVPRDDRQTAQQIISVDGYGVSTSGDYRNYFERDGKRYSHTLDARTGRPVEHALAAVTVLDSSALMADGLSTLLMILGPQEGWDYALQHEIAAFFVMHADKGFATRVTPAFEQMDANE
ncbi:FAD:protein FMN transferase [Pseudomonas sp. LS1212]|uniref:FAD:protein FMN transferase n=1 Tax=Pseudomonas sp. LS1212 TaxID=2972478 RepID=UPI00215C4CC8|nr:FAD:protein FMN transferase [Pseudomonas sp. LS1212]UVJ46594.1 FAD:protein FMN transferase [Pseudomonas sp. LS1212]